MEKEKKKIYYKISEIQHEALNKRSEAFSKGWGTGFHTVDPLISYKSGYSSIIFSYNFNGKTQFVIEECCYMAQKFGIVSVLYLTEAGDRAETILDIIQTYLRKNLAVYDVSDDEIIAALEWANKYFIILDCSNSLLTVREIYQTVVDIEKTEDIKVGNLVIDHVGNVAKDEDQKFFNIADNIKYILQAVTRTSKKFNLHTFIMFHVRDTDPIKCKTTDKWYLPKPEGYMLSGGQQSGFLGQQMISVWRPISSPEKYGIINPDTGVPFELNETHITVTKSKPKNIGKIGTQIIYFDSDRQSYYELIGSQKYYSGDYEGLVKPMGTISAITPSKSFDIF